MWSIEYIFYEGDIMMKQFPVISSYYYQNVTLHSQLNSCQKIRLNSFYEWFKKSYKEDNDLVIKNEYENLIREYERVKNDIEFYEDETAKMVSSLKLKLNHINRIKKYLDIVKREYEIINSEYDSMEDKDIVYSNDILGWYEETPVDIIDAIDNIYITELQDEEFDLNSISIRDNKNNKDIKEDKKFIINLKQGG